MEPVTLLLLLGTYCAASLYYSSRLVTYNSTCATLLLDYNTALARQGAYLRDLRRANFVPDYSDDCSEEASEADAPQRTAEALDQASRLSDHWVPQAS